MVAKSYVNCLDHVNVIVYSCLVCLLFFRRVKSGRTTLAEEACIQRPLWDEIANIHGPLCPQSHMCSVCNCDPAHCDIHHAFLAVYRG